MTQDEIGFGGVYRLFIAGKLVGEFVPGDFWTELLWSTEAQYKDVTYSWRAFEGNELSNA